MSTRMMSGQVGASEKISDLHGAGGFGLPKLDKTRLVGDQVFHAIHRAIMDGRLPAGSKLQIRPLAEELGTSPMPVREAIKRLTELGLVESAPYRGAAVKRFTQRELLDLYSVRKLLEVEATARSADHFGAIDLEALRGLFERMTVAAQTGEVDDYLRLDEEFLTLLYQSSGSTVLVKTIQQFWQRCRAYKMMGARQAMQSRRIDDLLHYQRTLIEAASRLDVFMATRATSESLDRAMGRIREVIPDEEEAVSVNSA